MRNKLFIIPLLSLVTLTACGDTMSFKPKLPKYYEGSYTIAYNKSDICTYFSTRAIIKPIDGKEYYAIYTRRYRPITVDGERLYPNLQNLYVWMETAKTYRWYHYSDSIATWSFFQETDTVEDEFEVQALKSKDYHPKKSDVTKTKESFEFKTLENEKEITINVSNDKYQLLLLEDSPGFNYPRKIRISYGETDYPIPYTDYMEI